MIAAMLAAVVLGLQMSINPCPLANNIAAISFIARRMARPRRVLLSSLAYAAGVCAAYMATGWAILAAVLSPPGAVAIQTWLPQAVGPVLIVTGMVLLGLIGSWRSVNLVGQGVLDRAAGGSVWGAGLLGLLLALSFCPLSAVTFFGMLLPLAASRQSSLLLPAAFGVGAAAPVVAFSLLVAGAGRLAGKAFDLLVKVDRWSRRITGTALIAVGVYCCLTNIFGLRLWPGG
jgi:hypothetical protein